MIQNWELIVAPSLSYYGFADKRDLSVLSEVMEKYSKVGDKVAVLTLGTRPGYPLITQLRRRPGLSFGLSHRHAQHFG